MLSTQTRSLSKVYIKASSRQGPVMAIHKMQWQLVRLPHLEHTKHMTDWGGILKRVSCSCMQIVLTAIYHIKCRACIVTDDNVFFNVLFLQTGAHSPAQGKAQKELKTFTPQRQHRCKLPVQVRSVDVCTIPARLFCLCVVWSSVAVLVSRAGKVMDHTLQLCQILSSFH